MKISLLLCTLLCFTELCAQVPKPQADTLKYLIVLNNGVEYVGQILADDGREILVLTQQLGKIYIPKSDVKSVTLVDAKADYKAGEYLGQGVFTTRYQFTTNAFPIKKGENYALVNLYGPEVHFAVLPNFSVGVMATWIASPIALAFKYTVPTQNPQLNFGVGSILASSGYFNQAKGFGGLHWGMATYGTRRSNVTLSLGYGHFNSGFSFVDQNTYYQPGTYPAVFNQGGPIFPIPEMLTYSEEVDNFNAPIVGISGIASVGKKASFIWDVMIIGGNKRRIFDYQDIQYFYDLNGQPSMVVYSDPIIEVQSMNMVFMPGMRFQKDQNRAFQVTLAGVIGKREEQTAVQTTVNNYSFPVPMLSWFYKF
ncbi:MAG: hypothetical protein RLZ93_155 [Bacteroidota bacterium]|jgi:hypothetical protein